MENAVRVNGRVVRKKGTKLKKKKKKKKKKREGAGGKGGGPGIPGAVLSIDWGRREAAKTKKEVNQQGEAEDHRSEIQQNETSLNQEILFSSETKHSRGRTEKTPSRLGRGKGESRGNFNANPYSQTGTKKTL